MLLPTFEIRKLSYKKKNRRRNLEDLSAPAVTKGWKATMGR